MTRPATASLDLDEDRVRVEPEVVPGILLGHVQRGLQVLAARAAYPHVHVAVGRGQGGRRSCISSPSRDSASRLKRARTRVVGLRSTEGSEDRPTTSPTMTSTRWTQRWVLARRVRRLRIAEPYRRGDLRAARDPQRAPELRLPTARSPSGGSRARLRDLQRPRRCDPAAGRRAPPRRSVARGPRSCGTRRARSRCPRAPDPRSGNASRTRPRSRSGGLRPRRASHRPPTMAVIWSKPPSVGAPSLKKAP